MRTILLLGAGKSATILIDYLLSNAGVNNWQLIVADTNLDLAKNKVKNSLFGKAVLMDVTNEEDRHQYLKQADIVLSLLPPALHYLVAVDCIQFGKNLLTASYIDEQIKSLKEEIKNNDLLFLCEMGLDPGLDHMSAKVLIDDLHLKGANITSFISHCGGLVAPESDDNPWHYKISWNPRNVVNAGKGGAIFKKNGLINELGYEGIFGEKRYARIGEELYCWYPNRNSINYIETYGMTETKTFIRTTLRHPDFIYGWKNIIDLRLTDENLLYETDGLSLMAFFKEHMERNNFNGWLEQKLSKQFEETKELLNNLVNLVKLEEEVKEETSEAIDDFMMVDEKGDLKKADMDDLKNNAAATIAFKMHESKLTLRQLFYLGMDDDKIIINKGKCGAADVLQFALQTKLALREKDRDMVIMMHEIEYETNNEKKKIESSLIVVGENSEQTAMAKTVGLPLGIATKLILDGTIQLKGLHLPVCKEIYEPVLKELEEHGIIFQKEER
jgi:saccharopine dehydrogenase-like NADP-dependent oxidoreductase